MATHLTSEFPEHWRPHSSECGWDYQLKIPQMWAGPHPLSLHKYIQDQLSCNGHSYRIEQDGTLAECHNPEETSDNPTPRKLHARLCDIFRQLGLDPPPYVELGLKPVAPVVQTRLGAFLTSVGLRKAPVPPKRDWNNEKENQNTHTQFEILQRWIEAILPEQWTDAVEHWHAANQTGRPRLLTPDDATAPISPTPEILINGQPGTWERHPDGSLSVRAASAPAADILITLSADAQLTRQELSRLFSGLRLTVTPETVTSAIDSGEKKL